MLFDLPAQFQGTRRVAVSPRVVAQLAARWYTQDFDRSGVLLGWWPAGPELLVVEAAIARGDPEWHQVLGQPAQPFEVEPPYIYGWNEAWNIQSGFWIRRIGYWALLPSPSADPSSGKVHHALVTQIYEASFQKLITDLGGLEEAHVALTFREHGGVATGDAQVFFPAQGRRPLIVDGRAAWPIRRPRPLVGVAFPPFQLPEDAE